MQQIIDANQENIDANQETMNVKLREMKEEIKSGQAEMKFTVSAIEEKLEAAIHSMWGMAKRNDDLPINDGGVSGVQGANLRENGIRSGASSGPQGRCHSENFWSNEEAERGQASSSRAPGSVG
jgi:hypothetical protein